MYHLISVLKSNKLIFKLDVANIASQNIEVSIAYTKPDMLVDEFKLLSSILTSLSLFCCLDDIKSIFDDFFNSEFSIDIRTYGEKNDGCRN